VHTINIKKDDQTKLTVAYSALRVRKDAHNRNRGLSRLEKTFNYEKYRADELWDGLKGYITNTKLSSKQIIKNYNQLWQIEKAFRKYKTDLRIKTYLPPLK
jgi:transposase